MRGSVRAKSSSMKWYVSFGLICNFVFEGKVMQHGLFSDTTSTGGGGACVCTTSYLLPGMYMHEAEKRRRCCMSVRILSLPK